MTAHEAEQLELLDPYDDGLDFGTWMENLPLRPPDAPDEPTRARARRHG